MVEQRAKMFRLVIFLILFSSSKLLWAEILPIPAMYHLVATEHRVPVKLFYALILNESRSLVSVTGGKKVLPWPWTVNHRGKAHYFGSREEAYQFITQLVDAGDDHFDVGLGQLNWKWHSQRFDDDAWESLDPYKNLSAAATYLREQFENKNCKSWELAIGCYHRPGQRDKDKRIAYKYANRVISLWVQI